MYAIDARDLLAHIEGPWDEFAAGNDAPELRMATVLGQPLWRYVVGLETSYLYRVLVDRVRLGERPIGVEFQCDAPHEVRPMRLTLSSVGSGAVRFEVARLATRARAPVEALARNAPRTQELLSLCSWCKRLKLPDGRWSDLEDAVDRQPDLLSPPYPRFSHGACPRCFGQIQRDLESAPPKPSGGRRS